MPNYCDYNMRVLGMPSSVGRFIEVISTDYNYGDDYYLRSKAPHLYRVFESNVSNFTMLSNNIAIADINGYCAWSVWTCMMEGFATYYNDGHNSSSTCVTGKYGTSLLKLCKDLNLYVEVYSNEPGMGFQEHYKISNTGKILVEEEADNVYEVPVYDLELDDFKEIYPDGDIERFKKEKENNTPYYYEGNPLVEDLYDDSIFELGNNFNKTMCKLTRNFIQIKMCSLMK